MSVLVGAIKSFLKQFEPSSKGLTQEGNITYESERYTMYNNKYRIHIIVEQKLEDLDEALRRALDDEDFHRADKISKLIEKRGYDTGREMPGIGRDPDEGI